MRRYLPFLSVFAFFAVALSIAGCSSSSSVPTLAAPATSANASLLAGSSPGSVSVTHSSGYAANITLPTTSDGSSGNIAVSIATTLPSGVTSPATMKRTPLTIGATISSLVFVVLTPSTNVTFSASPGFTFTLPSGVALATGSSAFVGFYDPGQSATGWITLLGPGTVSGRSIAFPSASGTFTLKAGASYVFVLFATAQPVTTSLTGPLLVVDLTKTNLPATTPVYVYVVGTIKTNSGVSYWLSPSAKGSIAGSNVNQPVVVATMNPGSQNPASCLNNGDNTNYFRSSTNKCNNNQLDSLGASVASAINGSSGTGGNYPSAWADYSIPATVGTTLRMNLSAISAIPGLGTGTSAFSGRIYISVGAPKMPITALAGGAFINPSFGNNTGQPGEWTLYDWIEFSYDSLGNFNGNTTQVNAFGIPLQLSGSGVAPQQVLTQSRSQILNYFASQPAPFGGTGSSLGSILVSPPMGGETAYPANATYLRAIAPQTIVAVGAYPSTGPLRSTFDTQIGKAYTAWQSTPLVTNDQSTKFYTGVVFPTTPSIPQPSGYPAGSLAFYQGQFTTMQALASAVTAGLTPSFFLTGSTSVNPTNPNVISSTDIWANDNTLAPPGPVSSAQLNVAKMIAAAFSRGVMVSPTGTVTTLLDDVACQNPSVEPSFYPSGGTWNPWAQYFHSITAPIAPNTTGLAYAFSYDDVCGQNPSIPTPGTTFKPGTVTITMGNL
jgi:hypothetical protein